MKKIIPDIIAFLFTVLFVYAGLIKLLDYQKFVIQISQSPLLTGIGDSIAWIVLSAEFLASLLMILPRFRLTGFFFAFGLMTTFTAYIIFILHYSPYVPCSCGGVLQNMNWNEHLIFNIVFAMLALCGIVLEYNQTKRSDFYQNQIV